MDILKMGQTTSFKRKADDAEDVGQSPTKKCRVEAQSKPGFRTLIQSNNPWVWNQKESVPSVTFNSNGGFMDSLRAELEKSKLEQSKLRKIVEDQKSVIERLEAEKLQNNANNQAPNNEIAFLKSVITEDRKTIGKLKDENGYLLGFKNQSWLIDEQRIKIHNLVNEYRRIEKGAQEKDQYHLKEIMALKNDLAEHKATIRKLETEKFHKLSDFNGLVSTVNDQFRQIQNKNLIVQDLSNKVNVLMQQNQRISQTAQVQDQSAKSEIFAMKQMMLNYEQTIDKLRAEIREEGEINEEKEELESLMKQVQHFQVEIQSMKEKEAREIAKTRQRDREYNELVTQNRQLKSRVKTLDQENETLLELTKKSVNDHKSIKGINRDLRGDIRYLEREVNSQPKITNFFMNIQPRFMPNQYELQNTIQNTIQSIRY